MAVGKRKEQLRKLFLHMPCLRASLLLTCGAGVALEEYKTFFPLLWAYLTDEMLGPMRPQTKSLERLTIILCRGAAQLGPVSEEKLGRGKSSSSIMGKHINCLTSDNSSAEGGTPVTN